MNKIVISVEDGVTRFLVNEQTEGMVEDGVVRRASHVEPVNKTLRRVFHALRWAFGEKGWVADFTRKWKCWWRINLSPIGGEVLPVQFTSRKSAIDYEIEHLQKHFI